jgi:uncharacterized protein (TIGR03435 family)
MKRIWFALAVSVVLSGQPSRFDVASIRPLAVATNSWKDVQCDGSLFASAAPVAAIAEWAYGGTNEQYSGWPAWAWTPLYEIRARADRRISPKECVAMVQALLAERFQLALRRSPKEMAVYHLTIAKRGAKVRLAGDHDHAVVNRLVLGGASQHGITMAEFARGLHGIPDVRRPVVDKTGLQGAYAFQMNFRTAPEGDAPDLFTALEEQLGLKLVSAKAIVDAFRVERIERPTGN